MFDGLADLVTTSLTSVVTDLLPLIGSVVGIFIAVKIVRRFIGR